jgi:hypothetical protein
MDSISADCDILAHGSIGLIEYSYEQFGTSFQEAHPKEQD